MDIHGNSGANTCYNTQLFGRVAFISYSEPSTGQPVYLVIIMTERIAFHATVRSSF